MSFCKNCGTNIGNANFCPSCGQAANDTTAQSFSATQEAQPPQRSQYYYELQEYSGKSTAVLVWGILSIVCCMGIGLIFEIITLVSVGKLERMPNYSNLLTSPEDIATFRAAKARQTVGTILAAIALIITAILMLILFIEFGILMVI